MAFTLLLSKLKPHIQFICIKSQNSKNPPIDVYWVNTCHLEDFSFSQRRVLGQYVSLGEAKVLPATCIDPIHVAGRS